LLVLVGLVAAGWRLTDRSSGRRPGPPVPTVIGTERSAVRRVAVESHGRRSELEQTADGIWTATNGAPDEAASLMLEFADKLFPLRGYRALDADPANPDYGLVDPELVLHVDDGHQSRSLALGAAPF